MDPFLTFLVGAAIGVGAGITVMAVVAANAYQRGQDDLTALLQHRSEQGGRAFLFPGPDDSI